MKQRRKTITRRKNEIAIYPQDWVTVSLDTYRSWCRLSYDGHPKGCDMWFSKRKNCDTSFRKCHTFDEVFDRAGPAWVVWEAFDLGAHAEMMHERHEGWTVKQCRNARLWQSSVKKKRNLRTEKIFRERCLWGKYAAVTEGFCINAYATLRNAGMELNPIKNIQQLRKLCFIIPYKVDSAGIPNQKKVGRQIIIY